MKQLTMTKVLTPLAALAFAFGVQAAAVSTDGFETETSTVVTNRTGWSFTYGTDGADDASAITAYGQAATPATHDGTTAGSNYLKLSTEDGMLFRNMDGASGGTVQLDAGLYVDTDVQFTITDPSDRPEVTGDDKFIVWLEADGSVTNLCVWAREFTVSGDVVSATSNKVYKLVATGANPVDIAAGSWHRLTVKALKEVGDTYKFPAFQVYVDGIQFKASSGEYIVDAAGETAFMGKVGSSVVADQLYFPAMAASMTELTKVGFSGEGALDNVVVTKEVPGFQGPATLTFAWESDAITSVTLTDLSLTLTAPGSLRVDPSAGTLAVAIAGTNLGNYNWAIDGVAIENPASFTITPSTKTYTITATAKDTVAVTFSLDSTWDNYLADISAVMIGDLDVTADIAFGATVNLKVGTNVTVTVTSDPAAALTLTTSSGNLTVVNGTSVTVDTFASAAAVSIVRATSVATVDGASAPFGTFEAALAYAKNAGAAKTITLAGNSTLAEVAAIADGNDITIDLAGNDIIGAADAAVFTVAAGGTLTITNSAVQIGHVITNGAAAACISNAGTLNLQAGKFNGPITGGANVTGGNYTETIAGAITPAGYLLGTISAVDEYVYGLVADSWAARLGAAVDGAYTIDDTNDLLALQDGVFAGLSTASTTFKQTANIDMTGVAGFYGIGWFTSSDSYQSLPAGVTNKQDIAFAGIYDGDGYTISNVTLVRHNYGGVFNNVSGTVRNLTVQNIGFNDTSAGEWGCAIVGNSQGSARLENLTSAGTVWGNTAPHNTAGIVIRPTGSTVISGCVNNVAISTTSKRLGGISAFTGGASGDGIRFINCTNNAALVSTDGTRGVGGILACAEGGATDKAAIISGCADFGSETAQASGGHAGAIVGSLWSSTHTYTDGGDNTFLATSAVCGYFNGKTVFGLAYALPTTISGTAYLTTVKEADLAAGNTYTLLANAAPTFAFAAAGDTIAFKPGSFTLTDSGITFAGGDVTSATADGVTTYTAAAAAAADWVDDPSTIPADTSVATQYPDLASSVLATADAKQVTEWAATNNVAFADVAAATSGTTYSNAFLLNCAPTAQAVEDETAAFKATITVAADGTVTVSAPEGKKYNGTLQLKGKAALSDAEWTNVNAPSSSYKFYKYVLSF